MICNKKAFPDMRKECEMCEEKEECFNGMAVGVAVAELTKYETGGVVAPDGLFVSCSVDSPELVGRIEGKGNVIPREKILGAIKEAVEKNDFCMQPLTQNASLNMIMPLARKKTLRNVKVAENTTITIDVEELKRQMEREIYKHAGLGFQFGA